VDLFDEAKGWICHVFETEHDSLGAEGNRLSESIQAWNK
jgi:hypothetical protein